MSANIDLNIFNNRHRSQHCSKGGNIVQEWSCSRRVWFLQVTTGSSELLKETSGGKMSCERKERQYVGCTDFLESLVTIICAFQVKHILRMAC